MERFQEVIFKSEKKKRTRWKGKNFAFLLERKPENLNLLQYQLSKHFSKIVFESKGMTKIFGLKDGKKWQRTGVFLAKVTSKLLPITSDPK